MGGVRLAIQRSLARPTPLHPALLGLGHNTSWRARLRGTLLGRRYKQGREPSCSYCTFAPLASPMTPNRSSSDLLGHNGTYWLEHTGAYWAVQEHTGGYWAILGQTEPSWTILGRTGAYWAVLEDTGPYCATLDDIGAYCAILGHTGGYWTILENTGYSDVFSHTGAHWIILDHNEPYWSILGLLG